VEKAGPRRPGPIKVGAPARTGVRHAAGPFLRAERMGGGGEGGQAQIDQRSPGGTPRTRKRGAAGIHEPGRSEAGDPDSFRWRASSSTRPGRGEIRENLGQSLEGQRGPQFQGHSGAQIRIRPYGGKRPC